MPTAKPRFNVTLEPKTASLIKQLARRKKQSVACMTRELIVNALEMQEDAALLDLAERCEKSQKGKKMHTHDEAWA